MSVVPPTAVRDSTDAMNRSESIEVLSVRFATDKIVLNAGFGNSVSNAPENSK
jgi:hypothetical protein